MLKNQFTLVRNYDIMLKGTRAIANNYLIKQLPKATVFINKKFEVVHASDRWINEFSFDGINIFGKTIFELFDNVTDDLKNILKDCLSGKSGEIRVKRYIDSQENEQWYEWSNIPWYDDKENIIGVIVQVENVTKRISDELKLEKLEILLKEKSEIAKIGSWEYDALTDRITWCEMTTKILEVDESFVPTLENGVNFYKEGHSRNAISMAIYEASEKGSSWNINLEIITAKNREKWVTSTGRPIFKNNEFIGLVGTFQDINIQVQTNVKSKGNEILLKSLIDNLPVNVFVKDRELKKILVNKSECDFLGIDDPSEVLGKTDFEFYDDETAKVYKEIDLKILNTQRPILGEEMTSVKRDGTITTFLSSKIPLINEDSEVEGIIGISLDITTLKQKEEELRGLINVTSLQNKKLINFAHIVSHNLRSHTSNFSMLLDFLVHEKSEDEKKNILKMLIDASDNLLETLENLNEVVAISTNVNLDKKSINLNKKITSVKQNLKAFLINNNAEIINTISNDVCIKVVPSYIDNILMNFITNAVKYSLPERSPIIKLSTESKNGYTILNIEDNGSGIDLKKHGDKLFGMYKTFHNNQDARGIGLYITKNQIEAMNGKVTVSSKISKGTTFNIYFNEKN